MIDSSLLLIAILVGGRPGFVDMTNQLGLGRETISETVARVVFADLNGDNFPDAVIDRRRVFLNVADPSSPTGRRFQEVPPEKTGLVKPEKSTLVVFADLDNDGRLDAITTEYVDSDNARWNDHGRRTRWQPGGGDGTFGEPIVIEQAQPATTSAIGVSDVNRDGMLDLWLGNWYLHYGQSLQGYTNQLLLQTEPLREAESTPRWSSRLLPEISSPDQKKNSKKTTRTDRHGRPTYGAMIANLDGESPPELLELNYGRRWNRLWRKKDDIWRDIAPKVGFDGDDIRHGRYPDWLKQRAKTDKRFDREDEKPFRSNGNTFDCSIGDIDNDRDFDVLVSTIAHGWASESSDRTRVLLRSMTEENVLNFTTADRYTLDRVPKKKNNWNQGDLFCELADLDHNSRLDIILSSGDYPDNQRLRIYFQDDTGSIRNATSELGIDHDGSQQISLGDVEGDGDLDILVGQTFNRFKKDQRKGRTPQLRLLINEAAEGRKSITLRLHGDGEAVSRDALGTIARATLADGTVLSRQLIGIGGHAGKQRDFLIHFGLGGAEAVKSLEVTWPDASVQRFADVPAGRYELRFGKEISRLKESN